MSSISNRIRHLRRASNLTQEELAKKVGTSRTAVANWEIGRSQPDIAMLSTLADTFQLSVDNLLGRTSDPVLIQQDKGEYVLLAESSTMYQAADVPSQHQEVLAALLIQIGQYVHNKKWGKILPFPFNVYLPIVTNTRESLGQAVKPEQQQTIHVQPDLTIIHCSKEIDEQGFSGVPDWIIEIISPATIKEDMQEKLSLYEQVGVPEYWIVHPTEQTILVFRLQDNGKYGRYQFYTAKETIKVSISTELQVNLQHIF